MPKIHIFDFCETLANFQTADKFVAFVLNTDSVKSQINGFRPFIKISNLVNHLLFRYFGYSTKKRRLLKRIKGRSYSELDNAAKRYYQSVIRPNLINETVEILRQRKQEGDLIMVLSAGYDLYLKYFVEEFEVDYLICTKVLFKNNVCQGKIKGRDCVGKIKTKALFNNTFHLNINTFDTFGYSDSISDISFLKAVNHPFVVCKDKIPNWAKEKGFNSIIWRE